MKCGYCGQECGRDQHRPVDRSRRGGSAIVTTVTHCDCVCADCGGRYLASPEAGKAHECPCTEKG